MLKPFKLIFAFLFVAMFIATITARLIIAPGEDKKRNSVRAHAPYVISERAQTLHNSLTVADLHTDSLLWARNFAKQNNYGHADIPRLRKGGVRVVILGAATKSPRGQNFGHNAASAPDNITLLAIGQFWPPRTWYSLFERARYIAQRAHEVANDRSNNTMLIQTAGQLQAALQTPQSLSILLSTEGSHVLEGRLDNIERLYEEGYRLMGLQHFFDNELGGSLHGTSKTGLSDFGRQAVAAMQARGIIIDVAHSSEAVIRDVLSVSEAPLILSHGGVRSACPRTANRNLPDELLVQITQKGGLIGIGFFDGVICDISPKGIARAIIAAINLLGEDNVALGSDFDGGVTTSLNASELAALTQALIDEGIEDHVIAKVMSRNAINFLLNNLPQ